MNRLKIEAKKILSWMYTNKYVNITLLILLGIYFIISPKISNTIQLLYSNIVFRVLIVLLIIFFAKYEPRLAIMITAVYLLTLNRINNMEKFQQSEIKEYSKIY